MLTTQSHLQVGRELQKTCMNCWLSNELLTSGVERKAEHRSHVCALRAIGLQRQNVQEMEVASGISRKKVWGLKIFMSTDFYPKDIRLHGGLGTRKLKEVSLSPFLMSPDKSCFHF